MTTTTKPKPLPAHLTALPDEDATGQGGATATLEQPVSTVEAPDAPELTAADVIDADKLYTPGQIEPLLGIGVNSLKEAIRERTIAYEHYGDADRIFGRSLLRWIATNNVRYAVSPFAVRLWKRSHPGPAPPTPVDTSLSARVRERVGEVTRSKAEQEQKEHESAFDHYLTILLKGDAASEGEVILLSDLADELEITSEQIQADLQTIGRARQFSELHDQLDVASEKRASAIEAYKAMEKRHEEEKEAALKVRRAAEHLNSTCHDARFGLSQLAKKRPELFDAGNRLRMSNHE